MWTLGPRFAFAVASALVLVAGVAVAGQPGGATSLVDTPTADCTVVPRSFDEVVALIGTPGTTVPPDVRLDPTALPTGEPVDADTEREIAAAAALLVACGNAGDSSRIFALYTDGLLRSLGPLPASTLESFATPEPDGPVVRLVEVRDVVRLADGRVSAIVVLARSPESPDTDSLVFIFARVGDAWLLDEGYEDFFVGDELVTVEEALGSPATTVPEQ